MNLSSVYTDYKVFDEKYYQGQLANGMKVIVYPRKKAKSTTISASVRFGSGTSAFKLSEDDDVTYIPAGAAHFLEHLLFWNANGESYMKLFNELNIDSNGMTGKEFTYYIAEIETAAEFSNTTKLLLDMVLNAEFSQENFEMEKRVIIQEANEGQNSYNTLNCLVAKKAYGYHDKQELYRGYYDCYGMIGKEIDKITRDFLIKCHNVFYRPSNMLFTVIGNVEPECVFKFLEGYFSNKAFKDFHDVSCISMNLRDNEEGLIKPEIIGSADINISGTGVLFKFDTREYYEHLRNPFERLSDKVTIDLIETYIFGNNGIFNDYMCSKGYANGNANLEFEINDAYRHLYVSFFGSDFCDKISFYIIKFIKYANTRTFSKKKFLLAKKMLYADVLRIFESESKLLEMILELYYLGIELEDYIDYLLQITKEEMQSTLSYILKSGTFYAISLVSSEE